MLSSMAEVKGMARDMSNCAGQGLRQGRGSMKWRLNK